MTEASGPIVQQKREKTNTTRLTSRKKVRKRIFPSTKSERFMGCFHRRLHHNITYQNEPWKIIHTSTPKTSLRTSEKPSHWSTWREVGKAIQWFSRWFDIYIPGGGLAVSRNLTSKVKIYGARFKRWLDRHVFNVSSLVGKSLSSSTSNGVTGYYSFPSPILPFQNHLRPQKHIESNQQRREKIFKCPGCPSKHLSIVAPYLQWDTSFQFWSTTPTYRQSTIAILQRKEKRLKMRDT